MYGVLTVLKRYQKFLSSLTTLFVLVVCLTVPASSFAAPISFPDKPATKTFIVDHAAMLTEADKTHLNDVATALLLENRTPVYVVTIESLSMYNADFLSIESYARELFNEWGIGYNHRNYGMLLLIAEADRKARIELGADWGRKYDSDAQYVMDKIIIPHFKEDRFSEGITLGVKGMEAMALGLELPSPYLAWWVMPSLVTLSFVCIVLAISMLRSGRKGIGWLLLTIAAMIIWYILEVIYESVFSDSAYDGDGFGGGFSGGGGATGGW